MRFNPIYDEIEDIYERVQNEAHAPFELDNIRPFSVTDNSGGSSSDGDVSSSTSSDPISSSTAAGSSASRTV